MVAVRLDSGETVMVDPQNVWMLRAWKWRVNQWGYVYRNTSIRINGKPKGRKKFLHREVLSLPDWKETKLEGHHINNDPLDNQYHNLEPLVRPANIAERNTRFFRPIEAVA